MKPVYFPFTFVTDRAAEALAACFGSIVVYRPLADDLPELMQTWVDKGVLDVRIPVTDGRKALEAAAKNYQEWVNLHIKGTGLKVASLKALKDSVSSSGRLLSSHIVTDIKKQIHGDTSAGESDSLMAARVFLYFAQEYDWQSQQVDCDLKRYRQKEEGLIRALKMEDDQLAGELQKNQMQIPDTSADYLIADRLEAWTRIFLKDSEISGLFVTHSPIILDHLLDTSSAAGKALQIEAVPLGMELTPAIDLWRQHLVTNLSRMVENGRPLPAIDLPDFPEAERTVSLSFYLFPDQSPWEFFSRRADIQSPENDHPYEKGRIKHTILGLVEI